ncbi:hypothetical protein TVAG_092140 [Trichomonas vaginalis G3]|uniref:Uncharacterized protein n=1 Tax=Trichomonas vaginalis (strain ATCC PRA-98 / G3) TaxID=412133 RepID=A2FWH1_TRIV3|nr:hypothetical protein TVAGG3_0481800 [Trichomonas vaginalis G3]EAX90741.1 hypothetical protein TVAG_092140 [Trichomonas vaginalis G3]KAI5515760.1 hypothetical protein TVAGG3_0481800 [Trichomonas vaginalis G3]|eukprot:XP_001303671.1 hypothetical protein [Trichomonas vaginalis G3]
MKNAKRFSWSEYFGNIDKTDRTQNGTALYDKLSSNNYYIFVCIFENCTENGAIYILRLNEIYTLIEDSVFTRCQSDTDGGSVNYRCRGYGHFVQQRNFHSESITQRECNVFVQEVKDSLTNKNYAFDISVSKCGENESERYATFLIESGDVQIKNINSTYNKCGSCSSIVNRLNGKSGSCNFSTFRENNQIESYSLMFESNTPSEIQTVSYCNVIGNKCGTDSDQILFICWHNTTVDHCVILNNIAVYMFQIARDNCALAITDSCIQSNSKSGEGTVTFERVKYSIFDSKNCFIKSKVLTAKVSCFWAFAEFSIALYAKRH